MRLCAQNSTATKYFSLTNVAPAKPYLQVSNSYLPLVSTNSTIAGVKLSVVSGNASYRALDYQSGSGYYNTTSAAVGNLSSTTALTRASTSGTNYGTRASTSGTSYLTRASTSGTTYLTRASTSGTSYLTKASTSGTTYLTRASTSGTTYLTRASTSATLYTSSTMSVFNVTFYKVIEFRSQTRVTVAATYGRSTSTQGGSGGGYLASEGRGTINPTNARANYINFKLTQNLNLGYQDFSILNGNTTPATLKYDISKFFTSAPQVNVHANGSVIYATSSGNLGLPWNSGAIANMNYRTSVSGASVLGNFSTAVSKKSTATTFTSLSPSNIWSATYNDITHFVYQERLIPSYATRASTSGTNYGTRASTSGTSYGTRASTSGTSYLTRASTSGTNYGTRSSTSGTSYLTRASTSGTTYLTRSSTSGYSGKLSSSSSKWA